MRERERERCDPDLGVSQVVVFAAKHNVSSRLLSFNERRNRQDSLTELARLEGSVCD